MVAEPKAEEKKIFEVREVDRDSSFLRSYLTEDLIRELNLFEHQMHKGKRVVTRVADEDNWQNIKETLIRNVGMGSVPTIKVEDADYNRNRVLYLKHWHDGRDLDLEFAKRTLAYLRQLWGHEVLLETSINKEKSLLSFENDRFEIKKLA